MTVSQKAVETCYAQLKASKDGLNYADLAKLTGYSIPTVKLAISALNRQGSISVSYSKPVVFKAVETPPLVGQTIIVREPVPPVELDSAMISQIGKQIDSTKTDFNDELLTVLFNRARTATPDKLNNLMVFLVNFTEVIRTRLSLNELDPADFDVTNSKKGK